MKQMIKLKCLDFSTNSRNKYCEKYRGDSKENMRVDIREIALCFSCGPDFRDSLVLRLCFSQIVLGSVCF